jgi:hypothetical protein
VTSQTLKPIGLSLFFSSFFYIGQARGAVPWPPAAGSDAGGDDDGAADGGDAKLHH